MKIPNLLALTSALQITIRDAMDGYLRSVSERTRSAPSAAARVYKTIPLGTLVRKVRQLKFHSKEWHTGYVVGVKHRGRGDTMETAPVYTICFEVPMNYETEMSHAELESLISAKPPPLVQQSQHVVRLIIDDSKRIVPKWRVPPPWEGTRPLAFDAEEEYGDHMGDGNKALYA